jgi:hypothetical protein
MDGKLSQKTGQVRGGRPLTIEWKPTREILVCEMLCCFIYVSQSVHLAIYPIYIKKNVVCRISGFMVVAMKNGKPSHFPITSCVRKALEHYTIGSRGQ